VLGLGFPRSGLLQQLGHLRTRRFLRLQPKEGKHTGEEEEGETRGPGNRRR
jgi:hypothetical protein